MTNRRELLLLAPSLLSARRAAMTPRQRVDAALAGRSVDRPPFSFWYHFLLEKFPAERHARTTLDFHRKFGTDLVKVMSDFPYPKPRGNWWELKPMANPFPEQIKALRLIREGLQGRAHFIETIFNSWNQAEKISSPAELKRLMKDKPQTLLDALEAITKSQIAHARLAIQEGASGVFLAIANAEPGVLPEADYAKFSEPFDKMVLDAVREAPLNSLHLHGDKVYMNRFYKGWAASVIHYSLHGTGVSLAQARKQFSGVLMGGLDERNYRTLSPDQLRKQWKAAAAEAGPKFILAPGCSVPNETTDQEMLKLTRLVGAAA